MITRHPEKVHKPINPIKKKPSWIRSKLTNSQEFFLTKSIVNQYKLKTVCQEANCPNITECWSKRHATFLIMGDICTRACAFCDVKTGKPKKLDSLEPIKISYAVKKLNLKHAVITSVDRDDLDDGGADHFYKVIIETKKNNPETFNIFFVKNQGHNFYMTLKGFKAIINILNLIFIVYVGKK